MTDFDHIMKLHRDNVDAVCNSRAKLYEKSSMDDMFETSLKFASALTELIAERDRLLALALEARPPVSPSGTFE